jgi:hypothetical protein
VGGGVSGELVWPGKRRENGGERRGRGGDDSRLIRRAEVGWHHAAGEGRERDSRWVPADRRTTPGRQRLETGGRGQCGTAMPRGRTNRGGGLTGGPWPQCRVAAPADR